jgi:5-(carboxyamino)imidazole ribonucleotide mutase
MNNPAVAILIGSDSDLEVVCDALVTLEEFSVSYDVCVLSAHRSPQHTVAYVKTMEKKGVQVFIAAAGGAAHLPGIVAAHTVRPVIGLPILTKALGGVDSLYSIVQMPSGVPVATVGINAAKNAGLLAIQILALSDRNFEAKMRLYKRKLTKGVQEKNAVLQKSGWRKYSNT